MGLPVGLLTVRYGSSRLPGKCLLEIKKGVTFLEWSILRALAAGFRPIVCTTTHETDDPVVAVASRAGVPFFRGHSENKVYRWSACLAEFNVTEAHLIDVDDPFFSLAQVRKSLAMLEKPNVEVVLPGVRSDSGEATVGTSVTRSAVEIATQASMSFGWDVLDVVPWTKLLPNQRVVTFPERGSMIPRFRLTLDYEEDLGVMRKLAQRFEPSEDIEEVHSYLLQHPELIYQNYFRNKDFVSRKVAQVESQNDRER